MKKAVILMLFSAYYIISSSSLETGGFVENYSSGSTLDSTSVQTVKTAIWLTHYFNDNAFFEAQGSASFSRDEYDILADVDYLYYSRDIETLQGGSSSLNWKAGRFIQSEFSGKVFDHRLDGISLEYWKGNTEISAGAGYTGLLPKAVSDLNISAADMIDEKDDEIFFAPAKFLLLAGLNFSEILPSHNLYFSALLHFDLRDPDETIKDGDLSGTYKKGGSFNTVYIGTGISGTLTGSFYYDLFLYGQGAGYISLDDSVYRDKPLLAFLTGGSFNYLKKNDKINTKMSGSVIFASGDENNTSIYDYVNPDKFIRQFIPVTGNKTGQIFSPAFSNILIIGTGISFSQPLSYNDRHYNKNLETSIDMYNFFRPTKGATSETAPAAKGSYGIGRIGTEIDFTVRARVFSDLGLSFAAGIFLPDMAGVFPASYKKAEAGGMFMASFSF